VRIVALRGAHESGAMFRGDHRRPPRLITRCQITDDNLKRVYRHPPFLPSKKVQAKSARGEDAGKMRIPEDLV
jgi:hypothetical protein